MTIGVSVGKGTIAPVYVFFVLRILIGLNFEVVKAKEFGLKVVLVGVVKVKMARDMFVNGNLIYY